MSNAGSASVSSMLSVSSDVVEGLSALPCMFAHLAGCITPHSLYPGFYKLVANDNESLMLDGIGIVDIMVHISIMWRLLVLGRPRLRHGMVREVRLWWLRLVLRIPRTLRAPSLRIICEVLYL